MKKIWLSSILSLVTLGLFGVAQVAMGQARETKVGPKARETLTAELSSVVEVAETRMKEGSAGSADLLKTQIAVNFAKYKLGELSEAELRKTNDPLEKKLIWLTRSKYALKDIDTDEMIAVIDFVVAHR